MLLEAAILLLLLWGATLGLLEARLLGSLVLSCGLLAEVGRLLLLGRLLAALEALLAGLLVLLLGVLLAGLLVSLLGPLLLAFALVAAAPLLRTLLGRLIALLALLGRLGGLGLATHLLVAAGWLSRLLVCLVFLRLRSLLFAVLPWVPLSTLLLALSAVALILGSIGVGLGVVPAVLASSHGSHAHTGRRFDEPAPG